jgi:hypothetical protein
MSRRLWGLLVCLGALAHAAEDRLKHAPKERVEGDWMYTLLPPDAIPAIDDPEFVAAAEARSFMRDQDQVLGITEGGQAKAYPTWMLNTHEIVNDEIGETPIAATW